MGYLDILTAAVGAWEEGRGQVGVADHHRSQEDVNMILVQTDLLYNLLCSPMDIKLQFPNPVLPVMWSHLFCARIPLNHLPDNVSCQGCGIVIVLGQMSVTT